MNPVTAATDLEYINELCQPHRPSLVLVATHPPVGNTNGDHLDALLETEDRARVAMSWRFLPGPRTIESPAEPSEGAAYGGSFRTAA